MQAVAKTPQAYDRLYNAIPVGSDVEWADGARGVVLDIVAQTEGATLRVAWEDGAIEYVAPSTVLKV